jgi:hypothetical protein
MIKPIEITDRLDDLCSRIRTKIPPKILRRKKPVNRKTEEGKRDLL